MQSLTSWFLANTLQILANISHNLVKSASKSMKIQSKITKMSPRSGPKATLEASRFLETQKLSASNAFFEPFY